MRGVPFTN